MGNSLQQKYNFSPNHSATAGHQNLFKIYSGTKKDEPISVWTFQRESLATSGIDNKNEEEQIIRIMRADAQALKSYECDGLIKAYELAEENKGEIAFVTERVLYSLSDLLSKFSHFPASRLRQYTNSETLSEIEISRGLLNLIEGLQYLHNVQKKLHLAVSPENIVVTAVSFQWKLCGFGLSLGLQSDQMRLASPYFLRDSTSARPIAVEPNLNYCPPEMTTPMNNGDLRYLTPASDVFSLGLVLYEIFRFMLNPMSLTDPTYFSILFIKNHSATQHQAQCQDFKTRMNTDAFPSTVAFLLEGMLQLEPTRRFSFVHLLNNSFFNTGQISILKAVETIQARDVGAQASILTSLLTQISSFPVRIIEGSILPSICRLAIASPPMWLYTLPLHVKITEFISLDSYRSIAKEAVAIGLRLDTAPADIVLAFLRHTPFLAEKFESHFLQEPMVALFEHSLDKPSSVQTLALQTLCDPRVSSILTWTSLTAKLLPKVCREACKNPDSEIKTTALYFLSLVIPKLDKEYISKNILPSLDYILNRDKTPSVTAAVIGLYKRISDSATVLMISKEILPSLTPLLADKTLTPKQFDLLTRLIGFLLHKVVGVRCQQMGVSLPSALGMNKEFEDNLLDAAMPTKPLQEYSPVANTRVDAFPPTQQRYADPVKSSAMAVSTKADIHQLVTADIWTEESAPAPPRRASYSDDVPPAPSSAYGAQQSSQVPSLLNLDSFYPPASNNNSSTHRPPQYSMQQQPSMRAAPANAPKDDPFDFLNS